MPLDSKLYVGDLPRDVSEKELERAFNYYGPLRNVWVARNPPGFAFVEFEDARDADDAVRSLDGANVCGSRVRVEHSTGKVRSKPWNSRDRPSRPPPPPRRGGSGPGGFSPNDRCYECGERGHYAYDCRRRNGSRGGSRGGRRRSRSRSRSRSRDRRSHSRSRSRSRKRSRSGSRSPAASRSRSRSKARVLSPRRSPVSNRASPVRAGSR